MNPEKAPSNYKVDSRILIALGLFLATGSGIDFAIHSNSGISDPAMREWFSQIFGREIISHIGNFIFAAAAGIIITAIKKIISHSSVTPGEPDLIDHIAHSGHIISIGTILAAVAAMENFRASVDGPGDVVTTFAAIVASNLATDGVMHNFGFGRRHAIRNHVDNFHFLANTPTSVDQIFPN